MIHINGHKGRGSSMFGRRPRSYAHVGLIVALFLGVVYLMYFNNAISTKLQAVEERNERYRAQQQSLSSQLQIIYEDRSRLENSLQKEKNDHQNTKDDLQMQKETHENILLDLKANHQEKYDLLEKEKDEAQNQLSESVKELESMRDQNQALLDEKQQKEDAIDSHKNQNAQLVQQKQRLQEQYDDLLSQSKSSQQLQSDYASRLQQSNKALGDYEKLKDVLKNAGPDVVKLDHDRLNEMSETDRLLLFAHLGGSPEYAKFMEQRREQLKIDQQHKQQASQRQQQQREERDRLLAAKQANQPIDAQDEPSPGNDVQVANDAQPGEPPAQTANICNLPLSAGSCTDRIVSYYFDPATSTCRTFLYSGCDGNQNRFTSLHDCEARCVGLHRVGDPVEQGNLVPPQQNLDPNNPPVNHQVIDKPDQPDEDQNGVGAVDQQMQDSLNQPKDDQENQDGDVERPMVLDKPRQDGEFPPADSQKHEDEEIADADHQRFGNPPGLEDELKKDQENEDDLVAKEEARAREKEEKAREELVGIENRPKEPFPKVTPGIDEQEAIKELEKMHNKQMEIAKVKEEEVAKYAALKAGQQKIHGEIAEDENEEEVERDSDNNIEEFGDQMDHPPAVQGVDENEPNIPVIDAPNVNEEEKQDENNMLELDGREEEDDDDDDFNDVQEEDKRDDEYDDMGRLGDADNRDQVARRAAEENEARRDFM